MTDCLKDLLREHRALMREYGRAQMRCSEQLRAQAAEIDRLQAQAMRLCAAVIVRDTALAWAQEERSASERSIPSVTLRRTLPRRVEVLLARLRNLTRKHLGWNSASRRTAPSAAQPAEDDLGERLDDREALEASLIAADLVICQTGCLSHRDYWRVEDHCKRTGKACLLVAHPDALRILSIDATSGVDGRERIATLHGAPNDRDGSSQPP